MSKPIFIMRIPQETYEINPQKISDIAKGLDKKLGDYHVLVMSDNRSDSATFECFNSNEADEIDIIELKKEVLSFIETFTNSKIKIHNMETMNDRQPSIKS